MDNEDYGPWEIEIDNCCGCAPKFMFDKWCFWVECNRCHRSAGAPTFLGAVDVWNGKVFQSVEE